MNENDIAKNPPTTVKELGIHLVYISQKLAGLEKAMHELPNGFASSKDLSSIDVRLAKLENRQGLKNTFLWVGLVASAIINIIAMYELFNRGLK